MVNSVRSEGIFLEPQQITERIQGSTVNLEADANWGIFAVFHFRFIFPISPEYPEERRRVTNAAEKFIKEDLLHRIKPKTTPSISWQRLGGMEELQIREDDSAVYIDVVQRCLGSFMGDVEDLYQKAQMLSEHHREVIQIALNIMDKLAFHYQWLFEKALSGVFVLEDKSMLPETVQRDFREEVELTPEEQALILERRKQRTLPLTFQEKEFIQQRRAAQARPAPMPEPEPQPEPMKAPPKKTFFQRFVSFFKNVFRR